MEDVAPATRRSRWLAWLIVALVVLAIIAVAIGFLSRPPRASRLLLGAVGNAMGLEITAKSGDYSLRGTPMLDVRGVLAREPGATQPLLRADRIVLSLPWSTIRSRGRDLTIDRIEMEHPLVDLAALQHWLRQRPPGPTRIPVLTRGVQVHDGRVVADGWRIEAIALDLPALAPRQPVAAVLSGRYRSDSLQLPFSLDVALTSPANDAAIGVAGRIDLVGDAWRLPANVVLSGKMQPAADGWQLRHAKLQASARYESQDTHLPFALGIAGTLRNGNQSMQLSPAAIALRGNGLVPRLDASGVAALSKTLDIRLAGALANWPRAWPPLPSPLDKSRAPLPLRLDYFGEHDLSGLAMLRLSRDDMHFDGRFHPKDVATWVTADASNPLPPLDGHLVAPRLDIAGASLVGVDVTVDDQAIAEAASQ